MTPEQGFLQDICENPEDDTPRLVYADWLDDHGDPSRAEFIRLQCELARLQPNDPRRELLSPRERELLQAHHARWTAGLGPLASGVWFQRGMPEELAVPEGTGNDGLRYLQFLPTLRGLGLNESAVTDEGLVHLKELNNLLVISPGASGVTDAALPHLLALPKLILIQDDEERLSEEAKAAFRRALQERFHQLSAGDRRAAATRYVGHQTGNCYSPQGAIREVWIHDRYVFDEELVFFTALPELELLELHEARGGVTSAGLRHLVGLRKLRSLALSATGVTSIDTLATLMQLESLCLCRVPSLGFAEAAALVQLNNLRELKLLWCDATDGTLTRLAALERLEVLELHEMDGQLTDEGLKALRGLSRLRVLILEGHRGVTNAGLAYLAGLIRLEHLDLSETGITDAGLIHLHGSRELECLVVGRTGVSIGGAKALADVLPKALIFVEDTVVKSPRGEVRYTDREVDGLCTLEIGDHWHVSQWEVRGAESRIEVSVHLHEDGFQKVNFAMGAEVRFYRQTVPERRSARDLLMETVTGLCSGHRLSGADEDVRALQGTDVASQRYYQHDTSYVAFSWVRDGKGYTMNCYVPEVRWAEWEPVFLRLAHSFRWLDSPD